MLGQRLLELCKVLIVWVFFLSPCTLFSALLIVSSVQKCTVHIHRSRHMMMEWMISIQPPGLMKMRLVHHHEHQIGHPVH